MTLDCDVHQGNGTAAIFAGTRTASALLPSSSASTVEQPANAPPGGGKMRGAHAGEVFTISLHQHNNYPLYKPPSSIDVDLPDGTGDDDYLAWLDNAISSGLRQFEPDMLCYVAGADPYKEDQLGGLGLTIDGLKKRDELVFRVARARDIPVMVTYRRRLCAECRRHRDHPLQHGDRRERSVLLNCHPERSGWFAKRSSHGVEGPRASRPHDGRRKEFAAQWRHLR